MKLYFRLAAGGIRRNSRLYVPYIMTCSLMVMMYYITDALSGDEMLRAMAGGYIMHELIVIGKVVMALFAAIFLFYTNSFLIKSRMREFGLYNILGMGKNGIARVMTWETLMVYVISMVFGLGAGILFSKLAELLAVKIVQGDAAYQFSVSGPAAAASLIVFAVIFLLICLNVLRQVFFSKPVELLRSENSGEKPPKANWFAAVLGALMLGLAYFMAVTIEEPLSAILAFMAAVLLVIAATYLLFVLFGTAGIYFQLNYSFLGAVQLLIYAGGITVLYVFSILLTSSQGDKAEDLKGYKLFVGLGAALASLGICLWITLRHDFLPSHFEHGELHVRTIGHALMSSGKYGYVLPFEVISILLLACIVGGILIARKR